MQRSEMILAALAAAAEGVQFDPVRIQKLLFLIDREVAQYIGGPHFDFQPCLYGPFDKAVFDELDALARIGQVRIEKSDHRAYGLTLTDAGRAVGTTVLLGLPDFVRQYFRECVEWVLLLPLGPLLGAIHHKYSDMAVNSVVLDMAARYPRAPVKFPLPSFLSGVARTLDMGGVLDEYDFDSALEHSERAIHDAWRAVGDELRGAMDHFHDLQPSRHAP